MPKKFIKKYMPSPESVKEHRHLTFLGDKLHDPNLWHLNRRSVATAFAVGLFVAWIPLPGQMIIAAIIALFFRANLPISIALVWVTNPLTMTPMFYFAYRFGVWILNLPVLDVGFEFSLENMFKSISDIGEPFLLGCLIFGIISSAVGYFGLRFFWRWHVVKHWHARTER